MNEIEKLREKYNIKLPGKGYLFVKRVMDIVCSAFGCPFANIVDYGFGY